VTGRQATFTGLHGEELMNAGSDPATTQVEGHDGTGMWGWGGVVGANGVATVKSVGRWNIDTRKGCWWVTNKQKKTSSR
jgi:hypothetical protein